MLPSKTQANRDKFKMVARNDGVCRSMDVDMFDDVVLIEQKLHSDGYNEGFFKGQLIGQVEGFTLGVERGKAFGQEVGFYDGFSATLSMLYDEIEPKSERLLKVLTQMRMKLAKLDEQDLNPQNQELFDELEKLRAKFKQVSKMVNTTPIYGKSTGSADF